MKLTVAPDDLRVQFHELPHALEYTAVCGFGIGAKVSTLSLRTVPRFDGTCAEVVVQVDGGPRVSIDRERARIIARHLQNFIDNV